MAESATVEKTAPAAPAAPAATTTAAAATTTATPAPDKGASTTTAAAATTDKTAATGEVAKGYWPDDWQTRLAGDDKDAAKQLGRYASPEEIWKKARSLEKRLSSGEYKAVLPKDAKPEELSAWRKDNGIPDKPESYDLKDLKIPASDKDLIAGFLKSAHDSNMTPEQAKATVSNYYAIQKQQSDARALKDDEQRHAALDALNAEWGGSFRRNVNLIEGTVLSAFPEEVRGLLKSARLPDGTAIFNSVPALKALASLALQLNPAGVVAPAGGGDLSKPALQEYQDLQKMMMERRTAYNKDAGAQARMRELIDFLSKQELIDGKGKVIVKEKKAA